MFVSLQGVLTCAGLPGEGETTLIARAEGKKRN